MYVHTNLLSRPDKSLNQWATPHQLINPHECKHESSRQPPTDFHRTFSQKCVDRFPINTLWCYTSHTRLPYSRVTYSPYNFFHGVPKGGEFGWQGCTKVSWTGRLSPSGTPQIINHYGGHVIARRTRNWQTPTPWPISNHPPPLTTHKIRLVDTSTPSPPSSHIYPSPLAKIKNSFSIIIRSGGV